MVGALVGETGVLTGGLLEEERSDFCLFKNEATGGLSLLDTACVEEERNSDDGFTLLVCSISLSALFLSCIVKSRLRAYTGGFSL